MTSLKIRFAISTAIVMIVVLSVLFFFFPFANAQTQIKNIEHLGIALDRTCIALIQSNSTTPCPTYEEIMLLVPDTSNQRISGELVYKNGMLQRENPNYKNHLSVYRLDKPVVFIDPPADTRNKITMIEIRSKLGYYFIEGSYKKVDNTIVYGTDVWVNNRCTEAAISAEKWTVLLGLVKQHLQNGCTTKNFENIVKVWQKPTEHDPTSSKWYQYSQWLKNAVAQSKEQFLISNRTVYSPPAR